MFKFVDDLKSLVKDFIGNLFSVLLVIIALFGEIALVLSLGFKGNICGGFGCAVSFLLGGFAWFFGAKFFPFGNNERELRQRIKKLQNENRMHADECDMNRMLDNFLHTINFDANLELIRVDTAGYIVKEQLIENVLEILDLKKTLVNVITKSGSTAETMSQYMIIKDRLEKELGDDYRKNIVATTDKKIGVLRQLADQEGYKTFVIPDDVGGRFSVFSAVGLLPLALVGVDIDEIMNGVKDMDLALKNTDIHQNIAAQGALIQYLMDKKMNKRISVMMPYSSRLKYVSDWFVQLWEESLGKEYDNNGNKVNIGPTPVKSIGATEQHSLLQLLLL